MSGRELFVYYRVAAADAPRCEVAVLDMQARLMAHAPRLLARLLARPETAEGLETWMETYAVEGPPAGGIDVALEARIEAEAAALAPLLQGPRHVEVFIRRT